MKSLLPIALAAAAAATVAVAAPADAAVYRIASATHASSSSKTEQRYSGRVTTTWKLARPSKDARNRIGVTYGPGYGVQGFARVNVTGVTNVDVTTGWKDGRCAWSAPTGDQTYPMAAPGVLDLVVSADPQNPKRAVAGHTGLAASLSNGHLGTECSTSVSGEPDRDLTQMTSIPRSTFRKRTVTLRFGGSTSEAGIAYAWSTTFVLRRVRR